MRTSGADADTALFAGPVIVLIVLCLIWVGGPEQLLRLLNGQVLDAMAWFARLLR
jgi:hypothetical protein